MNALTKVIAIVSLAAVWHVGFAQTDDLAYVAGAEELEKVKRARFRETYVNTGIDFSNYDKLYLGDAFFDYRDVGPAQRSRSYLSSTRSEFGISGADRETFETIADEAFMKEIVKGEHFTITDTIDEKTIIMRGAVVDIVSRVPPEFVGRSEIYLASVGEATLVLEFLDGRTGEVLARVAERGVIGRNRIDMFSMPANSVTVRADVSRWAANAARKLRRELDTAIGG